MLLFLKKFIVFLLLMTFLSGCAVVPTFSDKLEEPVLCDVFFRSVELEHVGMTEQEVLDSCGGAICPHLAIFAPLIFFTSEAISTPIYIVGNTANYLEKKFRCDDESMLQDKVTEFSEKMVAVGGKKIELEALKELQVQKLNASQKKIDLLELEYKKIESKLNSNQKWLDSLESDRDELQSELKGLN